MPGLIVYPENASSNESDNEDLQGTVLNRLSASVQTGHGPFRDHTHGRGQDATNGEGNQVSDYGVPYDATATSVAQTRISNRDFGASHGMVASFGLADLHHQLCGFVHSVCDGCFETARDKAQREARMTEIEYVQSMAMARAGDGDSLRGFVRAILNCGEYFQWRCSHPPL